MVNLWFFSQWPAAAHRNRMEYLNERLEQEACRVARGAGKARVFNFACGPARGGSGFLAASAFCEQAELTLAGFQRGNPSITSAGCSAKIKERLSAAEPRVQFQKKSRLPIAQGKLSKRLVESPEI